MTDARHSSQKPIDGIHSVHAVEYVNAAARTAAVLTSDDIGKIARQLSDGTFWILNAAPGTWSQIDAAGGGGGGSVSSVFGRSGNVVASNGDYTAEQVGADAAGTAAAAIATHVGLADPHTQYLTSAEGNAAYEALGAAATAASAAVATHVGLADPHTQYLTSAEGNAAYDAVVAAAATVVTHVGLADPHTQYLTSAEGNAAYDALGTAAAAITAHKAAVNTFTAAQIGGVGNLTSASASITIDLAAKNNFSHTLTENTTLAAPSNAVAGQSGVIVFTQHASSPKTLAYNAFWKFEGGTVPTLTATNGAVDTFVYYVESASRATCTLLKDVK